MKKIKFKTIIIRISLISFGEYKYIHYYCVIIQLYSWVKIDILYWYKNKNVKIK